MFSSSTLDNDVIIGLVTKNIYLQGFLCPRPVPRPPSFPLDVVWDYNERKIKKNENKSRLLNCISRSSQFQILSLPRNILCVSKVMPLCVATFAPLLNSSKEHCHSRHVVQKLSSFENYKIFTTFACMETVTDRKVKVKDQIMQIWIGEHFEEGGGGKWKNKSYQQKIVLLRKTYQFHIFLYSIFLWINERDTSILISTSCRDAGHRRLGMWLMAENILKQEEKKRWNYYYFFLYLIHKARDKYWL